ncbi:Carbohydrate binding module (family 35), partial [Fontibacillus panacisegetis]
YYWADAQIVGNTVVVSSEQVSDPVTVKYNWNDSPIGNLYNKDGLPASPFRTDSVSYLSVFGGSGTGFHTPGEEVTIKAPSKAGKKFDKWIGDIGAIANLLSSSTTLVMPNEHFTEVGSTYADSSEQPDSIMAYAKDAVLTGAGASFSKTPVSPDTEYAGDGYIWFSGEDGTADFTLNIPSNGEYELSFGYYIPNGSKHTSVSINGGAYSDITIPDTQGKVAEYSLGKQQLGAGANVVSFAKGWGYYGIEYVKAVAVTETAPDDTIEAESGILTGTTAVATSIGGYSGDGYVAFKNDGSITLTYDAKAAGNYDLVLGYSSPYGDKNTQLVINNGAAADVNLASSGFFTESEAISVSLVQGSNTILINSGWGYYNIDYIRLTPSVVAENPNMIRFEAESGTLNGGVTVSTESGGFSGTGYVTGFKTSGDTLQIPVNLERAGTYMLAIRYKTIGGSKVNPVSLNGTRIANYNFAETSVWKDAILGQYDFTAGANTIEIATSWGYMDIDYIQLTGGEGPVTSVNLKSSGASGAVDIPVTLYALADNSAEYRFLARKAGGEWEYVNNYSKNYSYVWTAPGSGEYELKAYARQIGSTAEFDAESAILNYTALPDYTGKPLVNPIFSSHMVLQRDKEVSIWGWAQPGTEISVKLDETAFTGTTDSNGNWKVPIGVNQTGDSHTITVTGAGQTVTLTDILFGDVYLTSGQSNMAFPMSQVTNAATEISNANNPNIRFFTVPQLTSRYPVSMVTSQKQWQVASPETVPGLTAVGYFYAKKLTEETGVPVGIIFSAVGGTKIENWTSYETLESMPSLAQAALDIKSGAANVETATSPTALYNGMIAPVAPYTLKGVLWYQGSSNWGEFRYYKALPTLIKDWRQTFGDDQLPFTIVQLAAFGTLQSVDNPAQPDTNPGQPIVRDAQLQTVLNDPLTSLVVTTDVGTPGDIHPTNKRDVGERAAISALGKIYNKPIEYSGPIYQSMEKSGNKLILSFDHAGSGLMAGVKVDLVPVTEDTNGLKGFAIAGADGVYYWADAQIVGNTVVVSSEQVSDPVTVKYNWNDSPIGNLYNKDGLPASPFRTDNVSYLSVFGGSGSGFHTPGEAVTIKAPSKAGKKFDKWIGDIGAIADPLSSSTTLVMPNEHFTEVGATFVEDDGQTDSIMAYAKDAVLTGTTFKKVPTSPDTEYAGDGYIWFGGTDGTANFTLNVPSEGEYELSFGYYNPYVANKKTSVSMNGGAYTDITIPNTEGKVAEYSLGKQQLTAGANVISFAKGWGYYGIEYVKAVAVTETVPNNTVEAESGSLTGTAAVATSVGGYSGDGYVAFKSDGSITLTYDAKAAGNYDLVLGYSSPSGDKKTQLVINSGAAVDVNLASSSSFKERESVPVNLVQGSNTILINSGWGYYNIDYIRLTPSVAEESFSSLVYGFEDQTLQGFAVNSTNNNQYNTALATDLTVTDAVYAGGNYSITSNFSLIDGGGSFQIRRMGQMDLSGASTITAKVKIVPIDEGTSLEGVNVYLFSQSGQAWESWTISNPETTLSAVDENGFMTITLDIGSLATKNFIQTFGIQVRTPSGSTGQATIYVDEVTIQ